MQSYSWEGARIPPQGTSVHGNDSQQGGKPDCEVVRGRRSGFRAPLKDSKPSGLVGA